MKVSVMLHEILAWCSSNPDAVEARQVPERQFRDMAKGAYFSDKQASWVKGVYEKLFDVPIYENQWSSGKVPEGKALATPLPDVLKKPLPLRPPGASRGKP